MVGELAEVKYSDWAASASKAILVGLKGYQRYASTIPRGYQYSMVGHSLCAQYEWRTWSYNRIIGRGEWIKILGSNQGRVNLVFQLVSAAQQTTPNWVYKMTSILLYLWILRVRGSDQTQGQCLHFAPWYLNLHLGMNREILKLEFPCICSVSHDVLFK